MVFVVIVMKVSFSCKKLNTVVGRMFSCYCVGIGSLT